MFISVTPNRFIDSMELLRPDYFTRSGLQALFDYLEDYEESTGQSLELDPIALCCEFSEYASLSEYRDDTGSNYQTLDQLREETTVIEIPAGGFILQDV